MFSPTNAGACHGVNDRGTCDMPALSGNVRIQSLTSNNVDFIITWNNNSAGIYTGTIDADGFVRGSTQDKWHPESRADWYVRDLAKCMKVEGAPPPREPIDNEVDIDIF